MKISPVHLICFSISKHFFFTFLILLLLNNNSFIKPEKIGYNDCVAIIKLIFLFSFFSSTTTICLSIVFRLLLLLLLLHMNNSRKTINKQYIQISRSKPLAAKGRKIKKQKTDKTASMDICKLNYIFYI